MQVEQANPVGTWKVSILAASDAADIEGGPLQAGAAEALIVFQPDHTVLSLTPGPGGGTWQSGGSDAIAFEFRELIGYQPDGRFAGYAVVRQQGTLGIGGDAFSSSGQGDLYDADGTYLTTNHTTTRATRVSYLLSLQSWSDTPSWAKSQVEALSKGWIAQRWAVDL